MDRLGWLRAVVAAGWLWGLAALPQVTNADVEFEWFLLLFPTGCLIGLVWVACSFIRPRIFRSPRACCVWLLVPVVGIGSVALSSTHYGLIVRVWLCDAELREFAESVRQNPNAKHAPRRVGLFQVGYAGADDGQVSLPTASGFLNSAGVVYRPEGSPPEHHHFYEHLYGPWWWFYDD